MVNFGNIDNLNAEQKYATSFGDAPNGMVYADPFGTIAQSPELGIKSGLSVDKREEWNTRVETKLAEIKSVSTTTGGSGLTDNVLIPIAYSNQVVDLTRKQTPVSFVMRSVTNQGIVAAYKQITSKPTAFFAGENATLTTSDFTPDVLSENIKYMYAKGSTTGPVNAGAPGYNLMGTQPPQSGDALGSFSNQSAGNANEMNVLLQAKSLLELEEETIINGDKSTNSEEFDGIVAIMGSTNTVDRSSGALQLKNFIDAAKLAYDNGGYVNFGLCDTTTFAKALDLINEKVSLREFANRIDYGFTAITINTGFGQGVPLVPSRFLSTTTGSQSCYLLDLSVWEKRVLQDMTYEKLAKTKDSDEFMLKKYMCVICMAEQFNASITNMTN